MEDFDYSRKLAISEFGRRNSEMMRDGLTDVLEDRLDNSFNLMYEPIAEKMMPYLEDGLIERAEDKVVGLNGMAEDKVVGLKDIEGIARKRYLEETIYDSLGNKTEVARRAGISPKHITRIIDDQDMGSYIDSNTPGKYDPMVKREEPGNGFFTADYIREAYEQAIDEAFDEHGVLLNQDAKDELKAQAEVVSYELADKLNGLDLAIDMQTKASVVAKDAMDILGAYGRYTLKDVEDVSKAVLFKYAFDSTKGDFKKTADLLKMGERNARRLHKEFKENDWGRKVVDNKKVIKVDFRKDDLDTIDRLAA